MEIDPSTKDQLIEFARSQMARRGEIDALIFTTKNIMAGLRKTSEDLDKTVTDVNLALHPIEEDVESD
jgi:ABC-type transporter Mla subunit MlaD